MTFLYRALCIHILSECGLTPFYSSQIKGTPTMTTLYPHWNQTWIFCVTSKTPKPLSYPYTTTNI